MSTYAHAVKVRKAGRYLWSADCPGCEHSSIHRSATSVLAHRWATHHAAVRSDLHWANWAAACRSCRRYGRVAPACCVCLGYGYEREREGLT